jgi:predicted AlkP superfamily pyrophosphatase or phosphodiesterase
MMFTYFALGNILLLAALFVFTPGFLSSELFPREVPTIPDDEAYDRKPRSKPPFDRVVFVLVDALRPDFVYGTRSGFDFTQRHEVLNAIRDQLLSLFTTDSSAMAQLFHSQRTQLRRR